MHISAEVADPGKLQPGAVLTGYARLCAVEEQGPTHDRMVTALVELAVRDAEAAARTHWRTHAGTCKANLEKSRNLPTCLMCWCSQVQCEACEWHALLHRKFLKAGCISTPGPGSNPLVGPFKTEMLILLSNLIV